MGQELQTMHGWVDHGLRASVGRAEDSTESF